MGGVCFALLLIFMQAGFLGAARANVAIVYTALDFDLVIHARGYLTLPRSDPFDALRLRQAESVPGVASVSRFLIDSGRWQNPPFASGKSAFILGISPESPVFLDQAVNAQLKNLHTTLTALIDRQSRNYGPWSVGGKALLNKQPISIVGAYDLGLGLLADGSTQS